MPAVNEAAASPCWASAWLCWTPAVLDASGAQGGGSIQVGGGFHGEGTDHNAERTYIAAGAQLRADATEQGDGGSVAIWADLRTDMLGRISARGGRLGGHGGMVETSGLQQLNMPSGGVDVSAVRGRAGHWLLDPANLTISNASSSGSSGASPFEPSADGAVLSVTVLNNALAAGTGVTVRTTSGAGTAAETGDIIVDAAIQGTHGGSLTLDAVGSIGFTGGGSISATGGALNVSLLAGAGVSATSIQTNGGTLGVTAHGAVTLGSVNSGALTIASNGGAVTLPTGTIGGLLGVTTGGGAITQAAGSLSTAGATLDAAAGSVTLGSLGSSIDLGVTTTTGSIAQASGTALSVSGATSLSTSAGTITLDATGNSLQGAVSASGGATTLTNAGALVLGSTTVSSLTATAVSGSITQAGGTSLSVSGATSLMASGAITVDATTNNLQGAVSASGGATTLTNAGVLVLGSTTVSSLTATAVSGSITQAGGTSLSVSGASSFTASGAITLDAATNSLQGAVGVNGGAVTVRNAGALLLGNVTASSLNATADVGSITQSAGTSLGISGATGLTAGGAITLDATTNSLQGTVTASGGATTLTNAGALVLGNVTANSLTATAGSGNITQVGGTGLSISGATTLAASSGTITLDATTNHLQGAVGVSGGAASLLNAGTLTLGNSSVSSLSATASSGNLAQAAGTSIAVSGATDLTASSGTITLDGTANNLQGTVTASGGATTLTSASLQLGGSTVSSLTATAASGSITQATGTHLSVAGTTDLTASGAITLDAATNGLQGIVSASGGATTLTNAGALTLGNVTAGSLSATATSGDITQAASTRLSVSGAASFTASGTITLDAATNTLQGTVNASGGATTLTSASLRLGDVNVSSLAAAAGSGNVTQASGTQLSVSGTTDLTASGAITLDLTTNNLQGAVTTSGGATTLVNAGSLTLGNATVSSLTATASAGDIVQASGTRLGVSGATSLTASSGAITLDAATNNLQGAVGVSGGAASLLNAGTLTLGNSSVSALTARSLSGSITQAGSTSIGVSGTTDLTASSGTITLNGAGNTLQGTVNASGGATTLRSAALTLGALNVSALTATAGSGNLAQAAGTSVAVSGATSLTASAGTITLNETGNGLQGAVSVSGGATTLRNGGTLVLGNGMVASLMATSENGDIAQAASTRLAVTGSIRLTASNGAIMLDAAANDLQGTVSASGGATTLTSAGLRLGDSSVSSLTAAASSGNLTQAAGTALVVSGTTSLTAGSGAITLNETGNNLQGAVSASGGATTLRSAALTLGNSSVNSLTATATSGNIAQAASSAVTVNGAATLTATSGSVTLGSFSTTGGSANLGITTGSGMVTLGTGSVGGTLGVSTSGNITQVAGGLTVNGLATLNAGTTGDISLTDTHNHWNGVSINARSLDLFSAGNLGVQSLTLAANQSLTLSAQGNLNLGSTLDINTGTGDLSLTSLGGSFTAAGKLTGHDIALTAQSGLSLSDNVTASGTLALTTGSGGIAQTGGRISAVGAASVDAGTSAIQLNRSANDFQGAVSLRGGATQVQSSGALTLGTLHTGNLTATSHGDLDLGEGTVAGTLNAQANGHLIKQTGALTLTGAITLNAGNAAITLDDAHNDLQGAITATGGGVSLRSANDLRLVSLTQLPNQALVLDAGGTLFLPAGTQDIDTGSGALTLASRGGVFSTFGTLKGGNVTLRGVSVTLAHNVTASGDLIVQGTNGTINQTAGDLVVAGTSSFDAGSQSITLNGTHNDFQDAVSLTGGATQVYSRNALKLADLATGALRAEAGNGTLQLGAGTVGGNLVARSTGAITQTGAGLDVAGTANINAGTGAITLAASANQWGGAVSLAGAATQLKSLGAVTLGSVDVGSLTLAAGGAVAQGASGITVNGGLSVDAGPAAITLNNAGNQLNGNVTLSGGTTQVRTQGALTLATLDTGDLTVQSAGALNLGQGSIAGGLTAASGNGAVTQAGVLNVTGNASIQSGSGNITLTQGNNQWGGVLSLGGGVAQVNSNAGLTLGTLAVNSLAVDVTGALNLGQGTIGSGGLTASSHGGAITQAGALDVTGASNLQAGAGDITLASSGNQWRNTVRLGGGVTRLISSGALTLGQLATGSLIVASSGALNLGQGSIAGDLTANSGGGAITQAGALHVTGGATFTATGANITLTNSGNQFLGALSLTGNAVAVFNDLSLNFGTLSFNSLDATSNHSIVLGQGALSGALTARALGGTITQIAGGLSVGGTATLQASSGITLADAANQFGGVVNMSGGDSALTNAGALRMGTLATGALTLRAGGALDLGSGSAGSLSATSGGTITQTGALSVGGGSSLSASGSITLGQSGNTFAGAVDLQGGNTVINGSGALRLGTLGVGDLTVKSSGALQLGRGSVSGALDASSGGQLTQASGGLSVGGASQLQAGSANIVLNEAANGFVGAVTLQGGDVSLVNQRALRMGSYTAHDLQLAAGGDIDLGGGTVNGELTATTRGTAISQSATLIVKGAANFIADGSQINLVLDDPGNQLLGAINMRGINGGSFIGVNLSSALDLTFSGDVQTLVLNSGGTLTLGGGQSTTLTAGAKNGIVGTGPLVVSGLTTLIANGPAMPVDLATAGAGNDFNAVLLKAQNGGSFGRVQLRDGDASRHDGLKVTGDASNLQVTSAGALDFGGGSYASLLADASATGANITQSGALDVAGLVNLQAGSGAITLADAGNHWRSAVQLTGGTTRITGQGALTLGMLNTGSLAAISTGALNLGQGRVGGDLAATSNGNAITQAGALLVTGSATLNAGGANITLMNAGNQFIGALSVVGNEVSVFNQASLSFGSINANSLEATSNGSIVLGSGSVGGALTAHALGGSITQAGDGIGVAGTAMLQAQSAITLTASGNNLQGLVNLSGSDTALNNAGDLRLGALTVGGLSLNVGGTLNLGAGNVGAGLSAKSVGAITQSGALAITGATSLDAGNAPITLDRAGNTFGGTVDLHGGQTVINNAGALTLGSLQVGGLTVASTGRLQLGSGVVGGDLTAHSGGAITQALGGLSVYGATALNAGGASIQLNETANGFAGSVSLQGGDVSLFNSGALQLGSFTTRDLRLNADGDINLGMGTASGDLTATTRGTGIGQTGALTVTGAATFIADGSQVTLALNNPGNQWLGSFNVLGINGGGFANASVSSSGSLTFSGDVQTLVLNSGGTLTLGGGQSTTLTAGAKNGIVGTGPLVVSGLTTLIANGPAMPVDLATTGAGNDFNAVLLKAQNGGSFGRVQLRDGDAVRRDGLQVTGDAGGLEVTSAGALDLGGGSYGNLLADTSATGAAITQSGALAVGALTTLKAGAGVLTLARADNSLPSITVGSADIATLVSAGNYTINASQVATRLDLGGAGAINLAGPLSGTGELVMNGTGSLTIGSSQGYSGGTRIESGRVVLQGPAASAGSGDVQLGANGELDLRDGAALSAALVGQGGNVLNTSGTGTLAGAVTLQALTTFLPAAGAVGLTISGAIGGTEGVRLGSAGSLTLTGSNSYSGVTDIVAGTLRANGAGSLSAASAVRLHAGAVLALGHDQTAGSLSGDGRLALDRYTLGVGADGADTAFSGSVDGTGGLTKLGAGAFTLAGSGAHTGATQVVAGNLILASGAALNATTAVAVASGATLTVQQSASLGSLAGSGTVNLLAPQLSVGSNGGSTRFDGAIVGSGGLAKLGSGTFTLAGLHTLAGNVQVDAGTLQLLGAGVLPATVGIGVAGGAALELLSDQGLGALSGSGRVLLNPYTLTLGASGLDSRFDGVISGSGNLIKAGTGSVTLGGRNLYTGRTQVSGGTLALATAQALAGATALSIDAGARVRADADQAVASLNGAGSLALNGGNLAAGADGRDSRFDGAVSGSGGLVKQGAGTLTLTAAASNSGATAIEAGTVRLTGSGSLGSGEIRNQGVLSLERSDAFTLDQAISGRGSLVITQGQVTLSNGGNSYSGATQVLGGSLITTAAERLPDASALQVAAGAQLQLGGSETLASLQAAGSVRLAGNLTTRAEQVYTGSLTLANPAGITLSGTLIDASRSTNQFSGTPLGLSGGQALVTVKENLQLGDVTLSSGGSISADRLALNGKMQLGGGSLNLTATAAPDDAKAKPQGTAQVPVAGVALAVAEATVQQSSAGAITLAQGARLSVQASGGGSVVMAQDANSFKGQLSVLSGAGYGTAWVPNVKGSQGVQSLVHVSGQQVMVGGSGIEADMVYIRADQLATVGDAKLVARLPFDEFLLGKSLSAPGMTLELAAGAFGIAGAFGAIAGQPINVEVGSTETGARTAGPNAGYLTVLPKAGAQGSSVIVLAGPKVGSQVQGGAPYRFFHDGASQAAEIPVVYNGVLPLTPAASGALSSINGDAEDARRARFQDTVRTENVTVRLRSGVIAEVGPGRPSTQGSEGARPPVSCTPATQPVLSCQPAP